MSNVLAHNAAKQVLDEVIEWRKNPDKHKPVSTGLVDLDKAIGGIDIPSYVAIGGMDKQGKSTVAFHLAFEMASNPDRPLSCLFCTAEEVIRSLGIRSIVRGTEKVTKTDVRMLAFEESDIPEMVSAVEKLDGVNVYFCDNLFTIEEMVAEALQLKVDVLFVDYLQLIESRSMARPGQSREEAISAVSRYVVQAKNKHKLTIIVVYQLNDEGKAFGSRAIYKDAEMAIEVKKVTDIVLGESIENVLSVHIRRARDLKGEATLEVVLSGSHSRLSNANTKILDFNL